jgi:hypothetical protein
VQSTTQRKWARPVEPHKIDVLSSVVWAVGISGVSFFLYWALTGAPVGEVLIGSLVLFVGIVFADVIRTRNTLRSGPKDSDPKP